MSLQRALQYINRGDFSAAEPQARIAVEQEPFNPVCHAVHGAALLELGDLKAAEERFKAALDLGLQEPHKAWFNLGKIYAESNRDAKAIEAFEKALEIKPDYAAALIDIGNPLLREGRARQDITLIEKAMECYRRAKKLDPKSPLLPSAQLRAAKTKAALLLDRDKEKEAIQALKQPLKRAEGTAPKLNVRTLSHFSEGETVREFGPCDVLPGDKEWYVVTENEAFLTDLANGNPEVSPHVVALGQTKVMLNTPRRAVKLERAFLLGGSANYYHWLLDYFPRLRHLTVDSGLPLLINGNLTKFQHQCLALAGVSEDRLAKVPMPGRVEVKKLTAPLAATRSMTPEPETLPWLHEIFGISPSDKPKRRLYVSRADATLRRVVNEQEVIDVLKPLGFEVVTPGMMDVIEQARAFSEAEAIVAPHGAALTNLAFAPKGCKVIEFMGGLRHRQGFFNFLAETAGQEFQQLRCAPQGTPEQRQKVNEQDFDMLVPIPALKEALKSL